MKTLQKICFVLLLSTFSSAYAGDCFEKPYDVADCKVKAEQNNASAQTNLALMYVKGLGVPKDYVMAHMYWNIAAVSGNTIAIENRGLIEKDMTSSQLAEAQKLAREWMSKHQ
jgi:TPR repeat protein